MLGRPVVKSLFADASGSVLPIVAASILVIVGLIGGGFDASRMYKTHNALQAACDAGVLAGRRAVTTNGLDTNAQTQAETYFAANFNANLEGVVQRPPSFVPSTTNNGNSVDGSVSVDLPMMMMQVLGFRTVRITATCSATMGVGNSDVTMVLDTTGSMKDPPSSGGASKISSLRTAMTNFYDTVATATQGSNARIRYAIVPYSSTVNVGYQLMALNPDYISDVWGYQTRVPRYDKVTTWGNTTYDNSDSYQDKDSTTTRYGSNSYSKLSSCQNRLPSDTDWVSDGNSTVTTTTTVNGSGQQVVVTVTVQPQAKHQYQCQYNSSYRTYYIYDYALHRNYITNQVATSDPVVTYKFKSFDYRWADNTTTLDNGTKFIDLTSYKAGNAVTTYVGSNGAAVQSTWGGCIEERITVATGSISYSSLTGMSPSDAADLDIDGLPDASDPDTQWKPMWPDLSYYRSTSYNGTVPSVSSSGTRSQVACPAQVRPMQVMGRDTFITAENELNPDGGTYHDIGMVWGARMSSPDGPWASTINDPPANGGKVSRHIVFMTDGQMDTGGGMYNAWGVEPNDRRITSDGSKSQSDARHALRFRALCDAVKAKGIRIWVIGFDTSLNSDLTYCMSPNSGFTASNATQLNAAFQEIAKQVGELRVQQ